MIQIGSLELEKKKDARVAGEWKIHYI